MSKFISVIMTLCGMFMMQSCIFYDIGKKDGKLELPEHSDLTYTVVKECHGAGLNHNRVPLSPGMQVRPITEIKFLRGDYNMLVQTDDGSRIIAFSEDMDRPMVSQAEKVINIEFRNYDKLAATELVGKRVNAATDRWGDYMYNYVYEGMHKYAFPQIMLVNDGRYLNGVELIVNPEGVIEKVQSIKGEQRNLFGSLPFYDNILSMNVMQWLMPGQWIELDDSLPSRGIMPSVGYSLLIYFIVSVILALICAAIYALVYRVFQNIRGYIFALLLVAAFVVQYVLLISLLDYYSAGWWLSIIPLIGFTALPFYALAGMDSETCPKCHGHSWDRDTHITGVSLPKMKFKVVWHGSTPKIVPEHECLIKIEETTDKTCKKCGYKDSITTKKEELRRRTLCPHCFQETLVGDFIKYDVSGNRANVEYEEVCSNRNCNYRMIHTLTDQPISSAPMSSNPRMPNRNPVSNSSRAEDKPKRGCLHCPERSWTTYVSSGAMCTAGIGEPRPCEWRHDQSQCPRYMPW